MWNTGLDEALAGIKIAGRNINNLRYAGDTILMEESEEELKRLLMKVKEESEKSGLKFNIQKVRIMASSPITSCQIDWETVETVRDFTFFTVDDDLSHEIKRRLLLVRQIWPRDITLPTIICLVKAMFVCLFVFPVVIYECEIWTIKKAEHGTIDAFKLWYWRIPLRVPWTARRSIQSILKKISSGYSLEGLMMKLKLWYFGHLMRRTDLLEKTLMLGKIEGRRRMGWHRMRWLDSITNSMDDGSQVWEGSGSWWWAWKTGVLQSMGLQRVGHDWSPELTT